MRRVAPRYKRLALALAVVLFSIAVSGCFQDEATASVDQTVTATPPPVTPTPVPPTEAPVAAAPQVTAVAQAPAPQGVFQGGPEQTQTAVQEQATLFALSTEILVAATQTEEAAQTGTSAALGTSAPPPTTDQNNPQPTNPPAQPGQPTAAPVVLGTAGAPTSGAGGTLDTNCVYTVVDGDRMFRIAMRFNMTPANLARYNGMVNIDLIVAGDKIHVPNCLGTPTSTPTHSLTPYIIVVTATPSPTLNGPTLTPTMTLTASPTPLPPATFIVVTSGPSPIPTTVKSGRTYVVQQGDTLFSISIRTGVRVTALAQANNISNINMIYAGQTLIVP